MSFCYFNDGHSFRAVEAKYQAAAGEVLFKDYATDAQLAAAFPGYGPIVERRMIGKSTITARLIAAGKIDAAMTALMANPAYFGRWVAADHASIYADDPDALALLSAIGADAAVIMAPED